MSSHVIKCSLCDNPTANKSTEFCIAHYTRWARGERGERLLRPLRKPTIAAPSADISTPFADRVYQFLMGSKNKHTIEDLADRFNVAPRAVREALAALEEQGKNVSVGDRVEIIKQLPSHHDAERINVQKFKGRKVRFGLTADNHLGSKYARLDVLNALFDIWSDQKIDTVYVLGNYIDGEAQFNKHDLMVAPGLESQLRYFMENWPRRKGITSRILSGDDHEGWYVRSMGVDIGRVLENRAREAGRDDIQSIGYMEHDVVFEAPEGACKMRLIHAGMGGAYALSYSTQKIVESYQGGEKPAALLVGHFHKAEYHFYREVHCIQAGCTMDQSPFMRKKRIQAHVGGWTVEFEVDDYGVMHGFKMQWHPFYDRDFYNQWEYRQ